MSGDAIDRIVAPSGLVPVVGRPNVGKSTLVNRLVGSKVAITSTKPQTTRSVIRGIVTGVDLGVIVHQMVLIDTPGLHRPRTELGNRLNTLVYRTLPEADVVLFVIDASQPIGPGDRLVADRLIEAGARVVLAVNKVDIAKPGAVADQLTKAAGWDFDAYVPVSAATGDNLEPLASELVARLPVGPVLFPTETATDQPDHLLASEIVREKFLDRLRDELPHSLFVAIESIDGDEELITVSGRVIVERDSQKGIVIGKGGSMLGMCGTEARHELEQLFGGPIHLDLRVAVERNWQERPQLLDRFGFETG